MSNVNLRLITDENMYNFVENSIRGGISMISTRPAFPTRISLTWMPTIYTDGQCSSFSQHTAHGFRFLSNDDITALKLEDLCDDDEDGYIYEVDLHYPTKFHNAHDDYPLAPESLVIDHAMYSPTKQSVFPESAPQKKLTPNLKDKSKYAVHSRYLKLYVQL